MNDEEKNTKNQKIENARFRSGRASRKPLRPVQGRVRKMARKNHPAIWNGKEKRLPKIESCMHPKRKPQTSRSFQRETPEQTRKRHAYHAYLALAGIL